MSIYDFYPDTPSHSILLNNDEYILNRTKTEPKIVFSSRFSLTEISVISLIEFGSVSVWSVKQKLTEMLFNLTAPMC